MSKVFHFGPIGHMKPVKMFAPGGPASPVGHSETLPYLSGRVGMRRSLGSHREYDLSWRGKRADVRHLLDCAGGMYGPGPYFFLDPMWMDENVLPAHWATPSLGAMDAPPIYGEKRPTTAPMPASDGTWPASGAVFRRDVNADPIDVYVPIPPGHTFRLWYAGTAGVVRVQRQSGRTPGVIATPAARNPAIPLAEQASHSVAAASGVDGVRISLVLPAGVNSATIYGIRAVVLPSATSPAKLRERGFVGGQGHSGVDFDGQPSITPYSLPYDSIGVTARLIEVD